MTAWLSHVKAVKANNKGMSLKQVLQLASKTYKKQSFYKVLAALELSQLVITRETAVSCLISPPKEHSRLEFWRLGALRCVWGGSRACWGESLGPSPELRSTLIRVWR